MHPFVDPCGSICGSLWIFVDLFVVPCWPLSISLCNLVDPFVDLLADPSGISLLIHLWILFNPGGPFWGPLWIHLWICLQNLGDRFVDHGRYRCWFLLDLSRTRWWILVNRFVEFCGSLCESCLNCTVLESWCICLRILVDSGVGSIWILVDLFVDPCGSVFGSCWIQLWFLLDPSGFKWWIFVDQFVAPCESVCGSL